MKAKFSTVWVSIGFITGWLSASDLYESRVDPEELENVAKVMVPIKGRDCGWIGSRSI